MTKRLLALALFAVFLAFPACMLGETHALLAACSEFITQPELGSAVSGNLQMIASALVSASPRLAALSVEDGTLGSREALEASMKAAFSGADEDDLSMLYLCTHGILSSADDKRSYLLLSDGTQESLLSAEDLFALLSAVPGEKLLIIDACYSGALLGRDGDSISPLPFTDPSIHVLTSASASESSWYYDSDALSSGAQSYFASAFAAGLGLYDSPEADANGDGHVSLEEMYKYLCICVPSSSAQLLSSGPDAVFLPLSARPMLSRALTGFSYGSSLLLTDDPVFEFSFTAAEETAVQYRLVEYTQGGWDWAGAQTFLDGGELPGGMLAPGRKHRTLSLDAVTDSDSGYLMLQTFSLQQGVLQLCSERLIAVQPGQSDAAISVQAGSHPLPTGEMPILITSSVPAEITVSIRDSEGRLIRRLCSSQLTRPCEDGVTRLYWDGRGEDGQPVSPDLCGEYTVTAEAVIGGIRQRAVCPLIPPGCGSPDA